MKTIIEFCEEYKITTINEIVEEKIQESNQIINEGLWKWFKKIWKKLTSRMSKNYDEETKKYRLSDNILDIIENRELDKIKVVNITKSDFNDHIKYLKGSKFYDKYVDATNKIDSEEDTYYFDVIIKSNLIELIIIKKEEKNNSFKTIYHEFLDKSVDKDSITKFDKIIYKQLMDIMRKKYPDIDDIKNFLKKNEY